MYTSHIKHYIDIIIAIILLFLLSPLLILIMVVLYFDTMSSPFFIQSRLGFQQKVFPILKFKTMNDKKDSKGVLLPDEERITKIGLLVRKLSLDELPQLFNVLKGDMSLIGPRPLLEQYLPLYNEAQRRRHLVKPGITGWAQVNGRNAISWKQKFEYDVWYVDNISFWLDIKILYLTFYKVLKSENIASSTSVTMEAFTGNES